MKLFKALPLIALGFALLTTPASTTGDAAAGKKVLKNAKPAMLLMLKNIKLARTWLTLWAGPLVVLMGIKNIQKQ